VIKLCNAVIDTGQCDSVPAIFGFEESRFAESVLGPRYCDISCVYSSMFVY
jgi:hypothetical protein